LLTSTRAWTSWVRECGVWWAVGLAGFSYTLVRTKSIHPQNSIMHSKHDWLGRQLNAWRAYMTCTRPGRVHMWLQCRSNKNICPTHIFFCPTSPILEVAHRMCLRISDSISFDSDYITLLCKGFSLGKCLKI
jgi:hypothetical protein